jgi:hypothetical protein
MTKRKKLRLDVEELDVEMFATIQHEMKRGTVRGHDDQSFSALTCYSCGISCDGTCGNSCSGDYLCDCLPSDPPA